MKKTMALLMAIVMLALPALGLAVTVNPEGMPIVDEPITLKVVNVQSPVQGDFNEIVILKDFAEVSNVHMEYTNVPASDRATQLSLMLASGDLPDVFMKMSISATDQSKYADEGMFLSLDDYAEYTPNLNRWFEEYPSTRDAVTQSDGKVYGAPYITAGDAFRVGTKFWYNTEVMELLDMEIPTTTDEFLEYLRAAKNLDYNGNGEADEIPISSSSLDGVWTVLASSFGLYNRGGSHSAVFMDEDGVLQYSYTSERWRNLLGYMNTLYTEGLLDQDIFTMDFAQLIAKASTGRVLTYAMVNHSPVSGSPYEEFAYGIREPFEGPDGDKYWGLYSLPSSASAQFVITDVCQYPEAAARWMDHWYSDEGIIAYFMGVEGVTYEKDENAIGGLRLTDYVVNNPEGINFEQVLAPYVPWAGGANPSVATDEYFKGGETWPAALESVASLINYTPEIVWYPFTRHYTPDDATESSQISVELTNYRNEWRAYFITGQKSLETDWDEYINGHANLRLDRYMELYDNARVAAGAE